MNFLAYSLKCWSCNSHDYEGASDFCQEKLYNNLDNNSYNENYGWALKTCERSSVASFREQNHPICLKMKVFYPTINRTIIHRLCHWSHGGNDDDSCGMSDSETIIELCETCSIDGCNSGLSLKVAVNLIFISVLVKLLLA